MNLESNQNAFDAIQKLWSDTEPCRPVHIQIQIAFYTASVKLTETLPSLVIGLKA